jgi:3-phenylpropionate/trans-cinnamate dioxygenase ferredoxin subunit
MHAATEVGADKPEFPILPDHIFEKALRLSELPVGTFKGLKLRSWQILISHDIAGVHAINDRCTHAASRLSTGNLRNGSIVCPAHGARFDLSTGKCIGSAYASVRCFPVRVSGDWVEVGLPDRPPHLMEVPVLTA